MDERENYDYDGTFLKIRFQVRQRTKDRLIGALLMFIFLGVGGFGYLSIKDGVDETAAEHRGYQKGLAAGEAKCDEPSRLDKAAEWLSKPGG